MSPRLVATLLSVAGAAGLYVVARDEPVILLGFAAAAGALAAIWLMSERALRVILAAIAIALWLCAALLAVLLPSLPAAIACGVGVAGTVVILVKGADWPGLSSRFERGADGLAEREVTAKDLWESLDRGDDPTSGDSSPGDGPTSGGSSRGDDSRSG